MARDVVKANPNNPVRNGGAVVAPGPGATYFNANRHIQYDVLDDFAVNRYNDYSPLSQPGSTGDYTVSLPNTEALLSFPAENRLCHVLGGIHWSYDGDPVGTGILQVRDSGNTMFYTYVTNRGPGFFPFEPSKRGSMGNTLQISLSPGGSGVRGTVGALSHWLE